MACPSPAEVRRTLRRDPAFTDLTRVTQDCLVRWTVELSLLREVFDDGDGELPPDCLGTAARRLCVLPYTVRVRFRRWLTAGSAWRVLAQILFPRLRLAPAPRPVPVDAYVGSEDERPF